MAVLLGKIFDSYNFLFYELADERSRDMFPSALTVMIVMPLYVYFSTNLGPKLMRDIKPFDLKTPIFCYNLFQIFTCAYVINLGIQGGWFNGYSFRCQPVDWTENVKSRAMLNAVWWYTLMKLIDLMDTVFFVLRKKDKQISFLHVYHHCVMLFASFMCLEYFPNGHSTFIGFINCFVHIVMYTYYLIAGLGPRYQKYLWWKKHLTSLQLIQFVVVFFHNLFAVLDNTCEYPKWINMLLVPNSLLFIYLFGNFYYVNYIKTPEAKVSNGTVKILNERSKIH